MELFFEFVYTVAVTLLISYLICKLFSSSVVIDHDHDQPKRPFLDSQVKSKTKQSAKKPVFVSKIGEYDGTNESNVDSVSREVGNFEFKGRSISGDIENLIDDSCAALVDTGGLEKVEKLSKGESEDLDGIQGVNKEEKDLMIQSEENCEKFDNVSEKRGVLDSINKELGICNSDCYNSVKELDLIREEKDTNKIEEIETLDCVLNSEDSLTDSLYSAIVEWERKSNNDEVGLVIKSEEIKNLECEENCAVSKGEIDLVREQEEIKSLECEEGGEDSKKEMDLVTEEESIQESEENCENSKGKMDLVSEEEAIAKSEEPKNLECEESLANSEKEMDLIKEEEGLGESAETKALESEENCVNLKEETDLLSEVGKAKEIKSLEHEQDFVDLKEETELVIEEESTGKSEEIDNLEYRDDCVNSKEVMDLVSEEEGLDKSGEINNLELEENCANLMEEMDLGRKREEIRNVESEVNCVNSKEVMDFVSEEEGLGKSEEIKNLESEEMDLGRKREEIRNVESEVNCVNSKEVMDFVSEEEGLGKSEEIKNLESEEDCANSEEEMDLVSEEEGMAKSDDIEGIEYEVDLAEGEAKEVLLEDEEWEGVERSELERQFGAAVAYVDSEINGNKILELDDNSKLLLYGLHKVATQGPCCVSKPLMFQLSARAKWNAWQKLGNMSPEIAMEQYIDQLTKIAPRWLKVDPSEDDLQNAADNAEIPRKLAHESTSSLIEKKDAVAERKQEDPMPNVEELNLHFTA